MGRASTLREYRDVFLWTWGSPFGRPVSSFRFRVARYKVQVFKYKIRNARCKSSKEIKYKIQRKIQDKKTSYELSR